MKKISARSSNFLQHVPSRVMFWTFKNPPPGLLYVYLKARDNPFKKKYPYGDNQHTLEDLLKYEIAIEEAFVFWGMPNKKLKIQMSILRPKSVMFMITKVKKPTLIFI
jgi:hypothetical protein